MDTRQATQGAVVAPPPYPGTSSSSSRPPAAVDSAPPSPPPPYYSSSESPPYTASPASPPPDAEPTAGGAHQQPRQVTRESAAQPQTVTQEDEQSYVWHMVFSCIVCWLCNIVIGFAALIVADKAMEKSKTNHPTQARKLGRISIGLSVCGIIVTIAIVVAVVALECANTHAHQGHCYRYKTYVGRLRESCTWLGPRAVISDGYCYTDSCYKRYRYIYEYGGSCYYYRTYANSSDGCKGVISGYYCYSNYAGIHCPFGYEDRCYWYKTYVGIDGYCHKNGYLSPSGYCYSGYCSAWAVNGTCYSYAQRVDNYTACNSSTGFESGDYCYYMSCPVNTYAYKKSCYNYKKLIGILDNCTVGVKSNDSYCYFDYCKYFVQGSCYRYITYVGWDTCTQPGIKSDSYCYYISCPDYEVRGNCYTNKYYVESTGNCTGTISTNHCYTGRYSVGY